MKKFFAIALLLAAFLAGMCAPRLRSARAADGEKGEAATRVAGGYFLDKQTGAWRAAAGSADTITSDASILAINSSVKFKCMGRPNFSLSARFSAAGKTCNVIVFLVAEKDAGGFYIMGYWPEVTITGPATQVGDSYMAPTKIFDTLGATHVIVAITTAPTGGATVAFGAGSS